MKPNTRPAIPDATAIISVLQSPVRIRVHLFSTTKVRLKLSEREPQKSAVSSASALRTRREDGYIEQLMKLRFPGTVAIGIELKNLRQSEMSPSLKDMLDNEFDALSIINNLLLQYAIYGNIENQEGVSN